MPDGTGPGPEGFPDEPSGGWARPEQASYPPPGGFQLPLNGGKILTGVLSALVLFLAGWVWQTNVELTELKVHTEAYVSRAEMEKVLGRLDNIQEKVDLVYNRIVVNPGG